MTGKEWKPFHTPNYMSSTPSELEVGYSQASLDPGCISCIFTFNSSTTTNIFWENWKGLGAASDHFDQLEAVGRGSTQIPGWFSLGASCQAP